ncbi:MAG: TylF/MycF/NovP-related O-methyltransferase [Acidimicrobiales bacterium]|nr:TylF/MycF/NovP-related O-methyltransferase [Acidimicrobiales bacterium]MDG1878469.1 TylF/MycF/NovP-related O-methyltransferase [Acidimicrobiales bacterium]
MTARDRYVDLLVGCLTRELFLDQEDIAPEIRAEGRDWPATAETMVGRRRLDNVRLAVETVLAEGVPGDLIETGVWRGGVTILMRGILEAWENPDRQVWVADSFEGLPAPNVVDYPDDEGHDLSGVTTLMVNAHQVRANFDRYGLLDDRVRFLEGWFADTLAPAPIEQLAVLRLDGDLYESTMDALVPLYDKVSSGGFVIVDDYGAWEPCRRAVENFRAERGITDEIHEIDWTGVYWRKS